MGYTLDNLRILIVDKNTHIRDLLRTILQNVGVQSIDLASDGVAGFEHYCRHEHDVVFTDSELAPITGFELVDLIRKSPESPNPYVPIMMLSGHTDAERIRAARDHGVTEFLAKPFTAAIVCQRIEAVIDNPRPFVRTGSYFGPDRRRKSSMDYGGRERRKAELGAVKLSKQDISNHQRQALDSGKRAIDEMVDVRQVRRGSGG